MPWLLNAVYLFALVLLSPWLLWRAIRTGRYRRGLKEKLFGLSRPLVLSSARPVVWFHGVSVGEVHLLRQVVAACRKRYPDWQCVISSTTDTGLAEAQRCFPDLPVFAFPFDFSWAVAMTLWQVAPSLVVLAECELWPNFLHAARRHGVPVAVINGRMSPRSFRRYRTLGPLSRWLMRHLDLMAVQTDQYASNARALGLPAECVRVTGSVKYDGARTDRANPQTLALRQLFGLTADDIVWVAGSTQAPEEEIALRIFASVRVSHPRLRLFLVPRQPDRFDVVARLLERSGVSFLRRSQITSSPPRHLTAPPIVLVDTMGELGALWGLADVAFVGGSLDGRRGGQNMIEPAAYGAAVVFGPHVWNFRDPAARLVDAGGAVQVRDAAALDVEVRRLLASPCDRAAMGAAGRQLVLQQQGATDKTVQLLGELLECRRLRDRAA
jgi:3-deoxy-D-manno-octulosonic-acid transferase